MSARAIPAVILDAEGDAFRTEPDQATVGYCDAVGVARQVGQHRFGSGEGLLGIYHPVNFAQRLKEKAEGVWISEFGVIAKELQFPGCMQLRQSFQNEPPVKAGQHPNGEEEVLAAGDPPGAVRRQAAARHNHMDMWMMGHRRAPGVKH